MTKPATRSVKRKPGRPPGTPNPNGGRTADPARKRRPLPVYFPPEVKAQAEAEAAREGRSVSGFVVRVVQQYFAEARIL